MTSAGKHYDNILQRLTAFEANVNRSGQLGRTNIHKDAERLFCYPLELMFGGKFINLNTVEPNYPAVDLGCADKRICVQVTSDNDHEKIQSTLDKFFLHGKDQSFDRLIVLIIGDRKKYKNKNDTKDTKYPPFTLNGNLNFDVERDIWGTNQLLEEIDKLSEKKLEQLSDFLDTQLESTGAMRPYLYLPPDSALGDGFVGREDELQSIRSQINQGVKPVVLSGLGGIGKTVLASRFGRLYPDGEVYFIRFQSSFTATITGLYGKITPAPLQPPSEKEQLETVMNILGRCTEKDLLIFDNVDADSGDLPDLMGDEIYKKLKQMKPRMLLTTRFERDRALPVRRLPDENLKEIFRTHGADLTDQQMDDLIEAVNGHTMTVDLMARTLTGKGWRKVTAEDMLRAIRENTLPSEKYRKIATDYNQSEEQAQIYQHLSVVFDVTDVPENGKNVLRCATLLPEGGMEGETFGFSLPEDQQESLDELLDHGWLSMENSLLRIHPIIRLVCREELKPSDESCETFLNALWQQYDKKDYNHKKYSQMAQFFAVAAGQLDLKKAVWINRAGAIWCQLEQSQNIKELYDKYLSFLEEHFPGSAPLATAYNCLGLSCSALGEYEAAFSYADKALTIGKSFLTENDPILAMFYSNIGVAYCNLGDHSKELKYKQKALEIFKMVLRPDHPDLASSYGNVGDTYLLLGNPRIALEYQLKGLEIRKNVLSPEHPDLANSYNNVGHTYDELGDHRKALEYRLKALEICEKVLPPEHPDLATSYCNVGCTYGELGDHRKEMDYQLKALKIREKVLPPEHPGFANSYNNVGCTYGDLGKYEQAVTYLKKALVICEKRFAKNDSRTKTVRDSIQRYQKMQQMQQNMAKAGFNFDNPFASLIPPKK